MIEYTLLKLLESSDVTIKLVNNKKGGFAYQIIYDGNTYVPEKEGMSAIDCIDEFVKDLKKLNT